MRFIELMPMGPCAGWDRSRFLPAETVLDRMAELEPIEAQGVARRYQLPGALGTVGLISPVSHDFCADCRRIRVTADGKLKAASTAGKRSPSGASTARRWRTPSGGASSTSRSATISQNGPATRPET